VAASEEFFTRRQAAAVLKHGVLARYLTVFTTMAGTGAQEVVLLDGYAGPGRYEDGTAGSPLLLVRTARKTKEWARNVTCVFCEADMDNVTDLRQVLAEEAGSDLNYEVFDGPVEQWAAAIVREAGPAPMLTFLDPFGAGVPYQLLTGTLLGRPTSYRTEVLLNINVEMVWRIGGRLKEEPAGPATEKTLATLDLFFGDTWWREEFLEARSSRGAAAEAAQHVVAEFCKRVRAATGFNSFQVPIRRRPGHAPLFILTLFYRHPFAPWKFNGAASGANGDWRQACAQEDLDRALSAIAVTDSLFGDPVDTEKMIREQRTEAWNAQEKRLSAGWVDTIGANLSRLLREQPQVNLSERIGEVYGSTLGLARDTHVREAWDALVDAGIAAPRPKSVRYERSSVVRA
jgi:three-Cys-motif partner protein